MMHRIKPVRIKLSPAQKEAIYAMPLSSQFRIVHMDAESGFAVYQHILANTEAPDHAQILAVATVFVKPCAEAKLAWIMPWRENVG